MFLKALLLKNFRNHSHFEATFDPKINLILGENGVGKTNLLEAIYLLSTGRSFRNASLKELILQGSSYFYIEALFVKDDISHTLKIGYEEKRKKIDYDGSSLYAFSELLGILPSTLFSPKDLGLIMGAPAERRRFLNIHLSQSYSFYLTQFLRYVRSLEQRNQLLKTKDIQDVLEIECFEKEMAVAAYDLTMHRKAALEALEKEISQRLPHLSDQVEPITLRYLSSFSANKGLSTESFEAQLKKMRPKEILLGTTLLGPHRDDIDILFKGHSMKDYCSEGQKRTFLAALKLAEWSLLKEKQKISPLFCVDDLGSHLDARREQLFENNLKELGQVFITSPHPKPSLLSDGNCKVHNLELQMSSKYLR